MDFYKILDDFAKEHKLDQSQLIEVFTGSNSLYLKEQVESTSDLGLITALEDASKYKYLAEGVIGDIENFFNRVKLVKRNDFKIVNLPAVNYTVSETLLNSEYLLPQLGYSHMLTTVDYCLKLSGCAISSLFKDLERVGSIKKDEDALYSNSKITEEILLSKKDVSSITNNIINLTNGGLLYWYQI